MPDYKETTKTITQWQRCFRAVVEHQRHQVPRIDFLEEVVKINGAEIREPVPGCSITYNPIAVLPRRDPTDDSLTGETITHQEVYAILYSAYRHAADLRDANP